MGEAEEIEICARDVLPAFNYHVFMTEFRELRRVPFVQDWHMRSLRIFGEILNYDQLTRRLFKFFQSEGQNINWDLSFLESAHKILNRRTYRRFFYKMLEFAVLGRDQKEKKIVGNCLLEIVKAREILHRRECKKTEMTFPFRNYEKFSFLLKTYLALDLSRFGELLDIIYEYKDRGPANKEQDIEYLKTLAIGIFGSNSNLTLRLLDYCTEGSKQFDCVSPIEQNRKVSDLRTVKHPTPDSMHTSVEETIQNNLILNYQSPTSAIQVIHPVQYASTLGIHTTDLVGKKQTVHDPSTSGNPKQDSKTSVGPGHSFQGFRTPVSAFEEVPFYPVQEASTLDYLFRKYHPFPSLLTTSCRPPSMAQVKPGHLVHDTRISNYSTTIGSSFLFRDCQLLVTADSNLNNGKLPHSETPLNMSRRAVEVPTSVPVESVGTNEGILGAKNKPCWI